MKKRLGVIVALLCLSPASAFANGLVTTMEGEHFLSPLTQLEVSAHLTESGAQVTEQRSYRWDGDVVEGSASVIFYHALPGGEGSTLTRLTLDGTPLSGETLAPEDADALRRELVLRLRDPAPLRDLGTPLFVSEPVAVNATPYGTLSLQVQLSLVARQHGTLQGISLPVDWHKNPVQQVAVDVTTATDRPMRALYSPYHELSVARGSEFEASGSYRGWDVCSTYDVTLLLSTGDEAVRLDVLPFRYSDAEGGYFLGLLSSQLAPRNESVVPRDIVIALDISGSMSGLKIEQAKAALSAVVSGLRPEDTFALITFNAEVATYLPEAVVADALHVEGALEFVEALEAGGGTNIHDAITRSFQSLNIESGHPRYVLLLTDGQPTEGETNIDAILETARIYNEVGARIFPFGIGDNVNTVLLDKLAMQSDGDTFYIRPGASVDSAVQSFFLQIANPILANPILDLNAFGVTQLYPKSLPDLFAGQTIALLGRYATGGPQTISLTGLQGENGTRLDFELTLPTFDVNNSYVPRIWAVRHVGHLLQRVKLGEDDPALVGEAMAVARRYGVITEFTYFDLDEAGDAWMLYSEVPVDVTGSVAVETSSSLDGYSEGGSVTSSVDTFVRFPSDRTFPIQGGYYTDTSIADPSNVLWTDLHFGSEAYFALAHQESEWGAAKLLGAAPNVRFELLGRHFRVTDPVWAEAEQHALPTEVRQIPSPATLPGDEGEVSILLLEERVVDPLPQEPQEPQEPLFETVEGEHTGCSVTATTGQTPDAQIIGFLMIFGMMVTRRLRRASTR